MKYLIYFLLFYGLYKFVTGFLLPLIQVTSSASNKMKQMQQEMNEMKRREQEREEAASRPKPGSYIDFEEIKS